MSQENVELVRKALEAVYRTPKADFVTINALFHPGHACIATVKQGKITRTEVYGSPDEALKAVGLRE